ncbi:hypothetical protein CCR85_02335 [Rhodothalassium salexigens]|uniref:hypothetical protein n=1 Tax=Rhodothalassium salexigens TaxID=1086 RepID=UPI00191149BC|nr:hypothetical protein [Rhodothalassium salexigens]MBK5910327.1 hypothetical protein [Rhodothalassium salexigens]
MAIDPPGLLGLAGVLLLARPVLRADSLARRQTRLSDIRFSDRSDPMFHDELAKLRDRRAREARRWRPSDRACLWLGYGCILAAEAWTLLAAP